jgi:phage tail-like protein
MSTALALDPVARDARAEAPAVASERASLRGGLPSLYREDPFAESFVTAFEQVLDPILALLDSIASHFDAGLAPDNVLDVMAAWLGYDLDDDWPEQPRRHLVQHLPELARRHGTRTGLELMLHLAFPGLPLRIEDGGRVAAAQRPEDLPPSGEGELHVISEVPIDDATARAVTRIIEVVKPAHVPHKLRRPGPREATVDE